MTGDEHTPRRERWPGRLQGNEFGAASQVKVGNMDGRESPR